jgi:hypothetical protein
LVAVGETEAEKKMKPIYWKINGIKGWYIWSISKHDILEGQNCGPFLSCQSCWEAIQKIENETPNKTPKI